MELRKGYKQTEVGVIPEDWEFRKLNEITNITRLAGYEYSTLWKESEMGEITALRGFNIGKNKIIERDFVHISNELSMRLIRSRLFKGDIVYPCVGTIGNAVVIEEDNKYHIQQNIAKITPFKNIVNPFYLSHYLMSDYGFREIEKFNGSSSQPNILVGSLRNYLIILPTLVEQTAIATALSDMDKLIAEFEQLIEKKKAIKQGAMQELLRPKEGWVMKKLADFLDYEQPTNYLVSDTEYDNFNKTPVLTAGKTFILGYTNEEFGIFTNLPVIIFDDFTTAIKYVDFPFKVKSSAMKILLPKNDNVNLRLIYEIMQQIKFPLGDHKRHWIGEYSQLEIQVPVSQDKQSEIATILSDMDSEILTLVQNLTKYQMLKQGMMQELLTGKTRLV